MNDRLRMEIYGHNVADIDKQARDIALAYFEHPNFRIAPINAEACMSVGGQALCFRADVVAESIEGYA